MKSAQDILFRKQRQPQTEHSSGDQVWHIERHGTNVIPESDYHGRPSELFGVWFGGNMSFIVITYGAILVSAGLNLWQSVFVVLLGAGGSYALVGTLGLAGIRHRRPTLAISSLSFGQQGNIGPALMSWLSLIGWEVVGNVLVTYTILAFLHLAGLPPTLLWTIASLLIGTMLTVIVGVLGHATLVRLQQAVTIIFGVLTLLIGGFLLVGTHWSEIVAAPAGPWDTGVLAMISIIGAATGITWLNGAADYTRYLPKTSSKAAIVLWTTVGSLAPVFPLILVGFLLTQRVPTLTTATNPITVIGTALPSWMAIPYLLTAITSMLAGIAANIYSSGLSLLATGIRLPRYQSVWIDGALMLLSTALIVLVANNFYGIFISFLQIFSVPLTAWAALFCIDTLWSRRTPPERKINWLVLLLWLVGTSVGLLFTASPFFTGPLAIGIFATSSFGYVFSACVSGGLYAVIRPFAFASHSAAPTIKATAGQAMPSELEQGGVTE